MEEPMSFLGQMGRLAALPAAPLRAGPGTPTPPPVCPPWALPCAGQRMERSQVQSVPDKAKCGEHDLCHADGQFRNAEGVTTSSEEAMLEQEQVTIMISSYCLLRASYGLSTRHLTESP